MSDGWKSEFEVKTGSKDLPVALRIDQIHVGYRLREVDPEKVAAIKASIEEIGLRTPVSVVGPAIAADTPLQMVTLVAGAHRLEAMKQLGREYVAAIIRNEDDLDAELWEIDENLCRAELTPADRALFVFRRKEIYLMKHPETGHGGDRASRQVGDLKADEPKRFTTATAEATGQSERAIQRDAERGEKISEKALRMLRGTRHDKGTVLDRLKSLRDEEQEVYVRALFEADKAKEAEAHEIRSNKMATKRAVRIGIINAIAEHGQRVAGEMPRAAYAIGYADPPWEQEAWSDETGQDKGLMYPPMPLDEIKALCAGDKSPFTRDAILFLWVTTNRLDDGISVLKAWGFEFVTAITWDKVNIGMGRWVRDRTEHLLIGKRGDFPGLIMGTQPESLYAEAKGGHSRKPVWFAEQIDRLFPEMRKLELFQRKESLAEGDIRLNGLWDFWGFEAGVDEPPADETSPEEEAEAEDSIREEKPKGSKKAKPSAWEAEREASAARKKAYRATIPANAPDDELVLVAESWLKSYHKAVMEADVDGQRLAYDRLDAIAEHLFGVAPDVDWRSAGGPPNGNGRFSCLADARDWLMEKLAAPDGEAPMFGQPGRFLIELFGCRVDFHYDGLFGICGGNAHVVDLDKPFFSETGYRSFQVCPHDHVIYAGGLDCKPYMERVCTEQSCEGGKKKVKLHEPPFGISVWEGGKQVGRNDDSLRHDHKNDPAWQPSGYLHALIGDQTSAGPAAPAESGPKLPPEPGSTAPVEFHVGGMRKGSFARFSVHLNDDGTYSISAAYDIKDYAGGTSDRTGNLSTFAGALRAGLAELAGRLRPILKDESAVCTSTHRACARAGIKWIEARFDEWGLGARNLKTTDINRRGGEAEDAHSDGVAA
ncbi:MT-A70 family methyltransferase [Sinorhizobium sp. CCBAU 05631]|uniref:MT-A70 family methyltransferase n=1 Tax=Sinorhizobium sp. CCBAU 05631 TaxID=794846 RepID=UPI0004BACCB4|nr:MT-A70 family methyltransferase [Sinorhizobium sp. CCBAU 05631]ASY56469.1 Adenine-specific DNA methyltransferase [Sinorhizobium sp. CCBAU 05631]